jgi:hypothetical protein
MSYSETGNRIAQYLQSQGKEASYGNMSAVLHSLATNPELLGDGGPVRTDFVQRSAGDPNSNEFAAAPPTVSGPPIRPRNAAPPSTSPPANNAPPMNMPGQGSMGALTELTNPGTPTQPTNTPPIAPEVLTAGMNRSPTDRTSAEAASQLSALAGQGPSTATSPNLGALIDPARAQTGNTAATVTTTNRGARRNESGLTDEQKLSLLIPGALAMGGLGIGGAMMARSAANSRGAALNPPPTAPISVGGGPRPIQPAQSQPVVTPLPPPGPKPPPAPLPAAQAQPVAPPIPPPPESAIRVPRPVQTSAPRPNILSATEAAAAQTAQKQNLLDIMAKTRAAAAGARGNINTTTQPPIGPIGAALSTGGIGGPGGSPDLTLQNILTGKGVGRMALQ